MRTDPSPGPLLQQGGVIGAFRGGAVRSPYPRLGSALAVGTRESPVAMQIDSHAAAVLRRRPTAGPVEREELAFEAIRSAGHEIADIDVKFVRPLPLPDPEVLIQIAQGSRQP